MACIADDSMDRTTDDCVGHFTFSEALLCSHSWQYVDKRGKFRIRSLGSALHW